MAELHRAADNAVETTVDRSYGMTRTEVHCSKCGGHLGHVLPGRSRAHGPAGPV